MEMFVTIEEHLVLSKSRVRSWPKLKILGEVSRRVLTPQDFE